MSIQTISTDDLRHMDDEEGLIIQGCGGDLQEWLDGINDMLTKEGILMNGARFKDVSTFKYEGLTCLLFPFKDMELDVAKLAMWRLQTHNVFSGTWLSDFVPNRLGGFITGKSVGPEKPNCPLIGEDGNIFNLVGIASRTLRDNQQPDQAKEMTDRVYAADSYNEALRIISEYVNITSVEEDESLSEDEDQDEAMGGISF